MERKVGLPVNDGGITNLSKLLFQRDANAALVFMNIVEPRLRDRESDTFPNPTTDPFFTHNLGLMGTHMIRLLVEHAPELFPPENLTVVSNTRSVPLAQPIAAELQAPMIPTTEELGDCLRPIVVVDSLPNQEVLDGLTTGKNGSVVICAISANGLVPNNGTQVFSSFIYAKVNKLIDNIDTL